MSVLPAAEAGAVLPMTKSAVWARAAEAVANRSPIAAAAKTAACTARADNARSRRAVRRPVPCTMRPPYGFLSSPRATIVDHGGLAGYGAARKGCQKSRHALTLRAGVVRRQRSARPAVMLCCARN